MPFLHTLAVTVPASTSEPEAERDTVTIRRGSVIDRLLLHVPGGHRGEVPLWIEVNGSRRIPSDQGEIRLDNVPLENLLLAGLQASTDVELTFAGYNEDSVNEHTARLLVVGRYEGEIYEGELFEVI